MNLGVYTNTLGNSEDLLSAVKGIGDGLKERKLDDASIFYDSASLDFPEAGISCGLFNSTDLWNFTGSLVATDLDCAKNALSMVNKFNVIYYYGWDTKYKVNTIALLEVALNDKVKTICRTEGDLKKFKRLTGKDAAVVEDFDINQLIEVIK